jgi:uncharacterized membrane protein YfbV (UPF0208 family)
MNIYPKTDKTLPSDLVMKVMACFAMLYFPMILIVKLLPPVIYGTAAKSSMIDHTVAMMMPAFMIGMGNLALRAQTSSLMNLLLWSLVVSILLSGLALVAFQYL